MKKVLIITDVEYWLQGAGHQMRIAALIRYLQPMCDLTVFQIDRKLQPQENGYQLSLILAQKRFDAVIVEYIHNSYYLQYLIYDVQLILDAHDIVSERTKEFRKFKQGGQLFELSANVEKQLFAAYDHIMTLSSFDADRVSAMTRQDNILVCPHSVDARKRDVRPEVRIIGFAASEYLPNRDGIVRFINKDWPSLYKKYDVELAIYGNISRVLPPVEVPGVNIKGYVPDLETIYSSTDVIINPVRFGAGLKIKNVEALANSLPLVTTPHGARGLGGAALGTFLVSNDRNFGADVATLIENFSMRIELAEKAYQYAKAEFSPEKCFAPLAKAIGLLQTFE